MDLLFISTEAWNIGVKLKRMEKVIFISSC